MSELDFGGVHPALVADPMSTFLGDDGHVWTVLGPSRIPLYDDVIRDDGVKSVRLSDWVRIAGLRCTGSIQRHRDELPAPGPPEFNSLSEWARIIKRMRDE